MTQNIKNKELLTPAQAEEVRSLIKELEQHKSEYKQFKSFIATCDEALTVADALLSGNKKELKKHQLKYTNHTAQKMRGIQSLSTYKRTSDVCRYLSACGGICAKCYADKSIALYKAALLPTLIYNTLLLKYCDIDAACIPYINNKFFRFEAFSDLQGAKHFKNLLAICKKNKNTLFTLWSKCGYKLTQFMRDEKIKKLPANLNIIHSEFYINKKTDEEYIKNMMTCLYPAQAVRGNYSNYLKVFIVYDDEEKRNNSGAYLCKNSCLNCLKCYKKSKKIIYIAERLH